MILVVMTADLCRSNLIRRSYESYIHCNSLFTHTTFTSNSHQSMSIIENADTLMLQLQNLPANMQADFVKSYIAKIASNDDFEKIHEQCRIQEEYQRLSTYVSNNSMFKSFDLGKIKVRSVSPPETSKLPRTFSYDEIDGTTHFVGSSYFHRSYELGPSAKLLDIEGIRYHIMSEMGHSNIEDYNFRITGKYNIISCETRCSYRSTYGTDDDFVYSYNVKGLLWDIAKDLGFENGIDEILKGLLELFWGEIVNTWHRRDALNEFHVGCQGGVPIAEGQSLIEVVLESDMDRRN